MRTFLAKKILFIGVLLLCASITSPDACAESDPNELPVPPTLEPKIPDAKEGIIINAKNAFQYRSILVPELLGSLKTGIIEFSALRKLSFTPVGPLSLDQIADPTVKPGEFLTQVSSALGGEKVIDIVYDLLTLKESRIVHQFRGSLVRLYPRVINGDDKTGQLFKERIRFLSPTPLRGFSFLTFRFLGGDEDVYWLYSPAIKKSRQLTGSNRSDGILRTQFAPDDIFGWSGKGEAVEGEHASKLTVLAPFLSDEAATPDRVEGCLEMKREISEEGDASQWNVSSRRFPQAAPWLPTNAVFVPREVYRIELESKDPYSLYGRQILYVDSVTLLPYYKFVFDRSGHPWKTIMSGYVGRQGASKEDIRLIPAFTTVEDTLRSESFIFDIARYASCGELPSKTKSTEFDPRHMGEEATPTPTATEEPSSEDEVEQEVPEVVVENPPSESGEAENQEPLD